MMRTVHTPRCGEVIPRSGRILPIVLLVALGSAGNDCQASGAPQPKSAIKTVCPGLRRLPRPEDPSGPGIDDRRLPEIVLLVEKTKEPKKPGDKPRDWYKERLRCDVKRVLYGSYAPKTVRFQCPGEYTQRYHGEGEFVVALIPAFYKEQEEHTALYGVPAADARAEAALCQARLDYVALACDAIFVGRELSTADPNDPASGDDWNRSTVEIVRVLHGQELRPGIEVQVIDAGIIHVTNYHRRADPQPRIYFTAQNKRVAHSDGYYRVVTHLAADQEAKVVEALRHAADHCITYESKEGGETGKVREVLFAGTDAQAIELLGADNDQAVSLFYRTLVHHRKSARPLVVAAIEQSMFRMEPLPQDAHAGFRRLQRLGDVLSDMQREDGGKDLERLIETYLARIEQGLPEGLAATVDAPAPVATPEQNGKPRTKAKRKPAVAEVDGNRRGEIPECLRKRMNPTLEKSGLGASIN